MTTLTHWLRTHHVPYVITHGTYTHALHCMSHHMVTAYATFGAHAVLYCYHG